MSNTRFNGGWGAAAMTALLVVSALAVPGLFVAPASAAQSATLTASPTTAGLDAIHHATATVEAADDNSSLNSIQVDYAVGSAPADISNVDQSSVLEAYIVRDDANETRINVTDDLSSVSGSNNGETLTVGFGGSYQLHQNDTVHLVYEDVQNPDDTGTRDVEIALNVQSTDNPANASYTVSENGRRLNVTLSENGAGEYAVHEAAYSPGAAAANQSLTNLTIDYGDQFSGSVAYLYDAYVDADNDGTFDTANASDRALNVTGWSAEDGELTVSFEGNYTLNSTDTVRLEYSVDNPSQGGDYTVSAFPNHDGSVSATDSYTIVQTSDRAVYVDAQPDYRGAQSTHSVHIYGMEQADVGDSLNSIQVDYSVGQNASDISDVGREDVKAVYIERYVEGEGYTRIDVTDDLSEVDGSNNGETLTLNFGGNYDLQEGDDIVVEYTDVRNPNAEGRTDVAVAVNVQSSDNPTTDSVFFRRAKLNAYVSPTICGCGGVENAYDGETNATWMLAFSPGETNHGQQLQSVTVDFGGGSDNPTLEAFDGDLSGLSAEDVTMAVGTTAFHADASDRQNLTVDAVTVDGDTVTFKLAGDYTLNRSHAVYLMFHDVDNPSDGGYYDANVTLNGENTVTTYPYWVLTHTNTTDASVTPADATENTTTNYTVSATVDPVDSNDALEEVQVEFEAADLDDATVESVRIEHADGTTTTVAASDYEGWAWFDDVGVYVDGDAGYTLEKGDRVVVELSGVGTPAVAGTYNATVTVNEGYWLSDTGTRTSYTVSAETTDTGGTDGGSSDTGSSEEEDYSPPETATPTATATPTETATPTPTPTETSTATETPTRTATPTATEVAEQQETATAADRRTETTSTETPGMTVVTALVSMALAALLLRRER